MDRISLDDLTSDQLDTLYARLEELAEEVVNAQQDAEHMKLLVAASSEPGHAVRRVVQLEAEVARLAAGQCTDSRRMCDLHHTVPVDGCPYPRCVNAREQAEEPGLRCVCGDPIQLRGAIDPSSWIHSPGSDTPCLTARPA